MLYAVVLACQLLLATTALPSTPQPSFLPYDYGVNRSAIIKRQTSNHYAVTGIHTGSGPNGSTPLRIEIRDLEKDRIAWTLYILGLDMLQYTPQTEMLSWYQIAGMGEFGGLQEAEVDKQQEFMADLSSALTMFSQNLEVRTMGTVHTFQSCFQHGIDPTWYSMRCFICFSSAK